MIHQTRFVYGVFRRYYTVALIVLAVAIVATAGREEFLSTVYLGPSRCACLNFMSVLSELGGKS